MKLLTNSFLALIWHVPALRRGTIICVALSLIVSIAEIAVALSMVPVLTSLGVDAGGQLSGFVDRVPPPVWLVLFAVAAAVRSMVNWLSAVQSERSTQELVVSLQSRLYRAMAGAHWDAVRHVSPPTITSALQAQAYDAGYGFSRLVGVIAAVLLVFGYLVSTAVIFPLILPVLLVTLALMWWLNTRRSGRVRSHAEDYVDAQTELHQRYEDWVAISRISSLGIDTGSLADRFESGAREVAASAIGYSRSSAATRVSYDMALVAAIFVGVPIAWWLETPPALLVFGLLAFVRVLPRASGIQTGYQGIVNAVAPLQAVERLAEQLEGDPVAPTDAVSPLDWRRLQLSDIGVEDTVREGGRRWIRIISISNSSMGHGSA
jgi:ABC-type siderophore export system fused ATPase/permease subunit